ncbi:ABC1 kinase family protein [Sphingomonas hengshuiensis]|uniref:ABC1 kinase family protein n=1 Tax=Sphingomonas hengshuiensis TaxID=1609977 RepID=UPI0009820C7E|nr:AarF/UbiB family protein [Sphingomonas hengshuiensis]
MQTMAQPRPGPTLPRTLRRAARLAWVLLHRLAPVLPRPTSARLYPAIRRAIEDLGLTYLKFGQFMAMRFDILPPALCQELARLFEAVEPVPFADIHAVIAAELGAAPEHLYDRLDPVPIASASVAQVHVAWTRAGEKVAVKVQRPGIGPIFEADMRLLAAYGGMLDRLGLSSVFSVRETVEEFAQWTRGELDFTQEGHVAERLRREAGPWERFPRIHWDLTSRRVLTSEFIEGPTLGKVLARMEQLGDGPEAEAELRRTFPSLDLSLFSHNLVQSVLHQLFSRGFFHGDPHPGNVIVGLDNQVTFVDFGIFGALHPRQRCVLARQIQRISIGDVDGCYDCVRQQYVAATDRTDWRAFERETKDRLRAWYRASMDPSSSLKARHLGNHSGEIIDAARRHGLRGGSSTLLYWRALYMLDASALKLGAHVDLFAEMALFFRSQGKDTARLPALYGAPDAVIDPARSTARRRIATRLASGATVRDRRVRRLWSDQSRRQRDRAAYHLVLLLVLLGGVFWLLKPLPGAA